MTLGREPDPAFAAACHGLSGGNPFLVGELAGEVRRTRIAPTRQAAGDVGSLRPAGVRTTALVRLARLAEPARRLAGTLALLGDDSGLVVAAELAGLDEAVAAAAALELEQAGLVSGADGLAFVHPLLRAAITTDDIPSVERAAGHAAAARVLARHGAAPTRGAAPAAHRARRRSVGRRDPCAPARSRR